MKQRLLDLFRRYRLFLLLLALDLLLLVLRPATGAQAFRQTGSNLLGMLSVLPPIFVLLGLLDVWVERETMIRYMGAGSGARGALLAFLMGSAAAGPLYAAFPIAAVLLRKGAKMTNVFIFLGAWSTTKIPLLLFEASSLGLRYTLLRLGGNIVGILAIAHAMDRSLPADEQQRIRENAEHL